MSVSVWTVYDHPRDWPEGWIARESVTSSAGVTPTHSFVSAPTLELVRAALEMKGLVRLERDPDDEPGIVEVWI